MVPVEHEPHGLGVVPGPCDINMVPLRPLRPLLEGGPPEPEVAVGDNAVTPPFGRPRVTPPGFVVQGEPLHGQRPVGPAEAR